MFLLNENMVKARKEHSCRGCGKVYPKGSQMLNAMYMDRYGKYVSVYWCATCLEYMSRHGLTIAGEWELGELLSFDRAGWQDVNLEIIDRKQ
ncbi:MAG: hypothetical protein FWG88_05120 [Oscillospiraceae bacterium]|nr:hypothetical protein [Oscillospiraceae bacterium]